MWSSGYDGNEVCDNSEVKRCLMKLSKVSVLTIFSRRTIHANKQGYSKSCLWHTFSGLANMHDHCVHTREPFEAAESRMPKKASSVMAKRESVTTQACDILITPSQRFSVRWHDLEGYRPPMDAVRVNRVSSIANLGHRVMCSRNLHLGSLTGLSRLRPWEFVIYALLQWGIRFTEAFLSVMDTFAARNIHYERCIEPWTHLPLVTSALFFLIYASII